MRKIVSRRAERQKGVNTVVGTIILIAGTFLIASVSLGYVLGISQMQIKHFTITSLNLYSGTASTRGGGSVCTGTAVLLVTFNNPGSAV
ncbi:MAG TPA: hypothetical protein VFF30_13875 [Nitrososphaerales archaeon]|nr:hypothetical protein [Nitrososphaerales archaeon]